MTTTDSSKSYYTTSTSPNSYTYGYEFVEYKPLKRKKIDFGDISDYRPWTIPSKPKTKEEVKELFEEKILVKLKDGITVEITYGELYEIEKTGREIEELTVEELKELLVMLKL